MSYAGKLSPAYNERELVFRDFGDQGAELCRQCGQQIMRMATGQCPCCGCICEGKAPQWSLADVGRELGRKYAERINRRVLEALGA